MQTLGLSDSTIRSDGRLKSLFWPSVESGADVDYLAVQGFWVCTAVGVVSLVLLSVGNHPIVGLLVLIFFHFGGVGVREHNPFAAAIMVVYYLLDTLMTGIGIVRIIIGALLLSNLRAAWIADHWKPESEEAALPPRFADTFADKFADRWPAIIWPKIKWLYYVYSFGFLAMTVSGIIILMIRRGRF